MLTERSVMKLAHCPTCRDFVALLQLDGYPNVTLKHMRRAHVDHALTRKRYRRVLIRKGRKP
jgi:hypothetical protein